MNMKKFFKTLWLMTSVLYGPIYIIAHILNLVFRFMLAITYFGLLEPCKGKDIIKSIFTRYEKL